MNKLQIYAVVIKALPLVITVIQEIEKAIPEEGVGVHKLALARIALQLALDMGTDFDAVWPTLANAITVLVKIYT